MSDFSESFTMGRMMAEMIVCTECGKPYAASGGECPFCGAKKVSMCAKDPASNKTDGEQVDSQAKCKGCGKTVNPSAKRCSICGTTNPVNHGHGGPVAFSIFIACVVAVIVLTANFDGNGGGEVKQAEKEQLTDDMLKFLIHGKSKEAVKARLRSPRSAKFPWGASEYQVNRQDDTMVISSYVDAQNGFGAMIRNYYEVEIRLWHGGDGKLRYAVEDVRLYSR